MKKSIPLNAVLNERKLKEKCLIFVPGPSDHFLTAWVDRVNREFLFRNDRQEFIGTRPARPTVPPSPGDAKLEEFGRVLLQPLSRKHGVPQPQFFLLSLSSSFLYLNTT
jgi:hypothetical protein